MKIENLKVGQKVKVYVKDDNNKVVKFWGKVISNSQKTKNIKFENKKCLYECDYKEIKKIKTLKNIFYSLIVKILVILIIVFLFNRGLFLFYRSRIHCGYESFEPFGGGCQTILVCKGFSCQCECIPGTEEFKPIIYLYPTKETEVSVKVGYPEKFTHTYPHYVDGWNVIAKPNGDLKDIKTGRNLYALYWEGKDTEANQKVQDGFVVEGKNIISFLEEKLAQLGLSEREADEFIIYWLPKLESNQYNFIRFKTIEEQNKNMPLWVTPKPDTVIRVMMEYDDLDKPRNIIEQELPPVPQRKGFTLVEWGGTKIDMEK